MPIHKRLTSAFAAAESRRLLRERTGRSQVVLAGRAASAIWATLRALDLYLELAERARRRGRES